MSLNQIGSSGLGPRVSPDHVKFMRFGAMGVTSTYKSKVFGATDVTKPYKVITLEAMDVTNSTI
jgi:hypothetical protein